MLKTFFTALVTLFFCVTAIHAEKFAPIGTSVAQFLEIGMGARATGMGEAYTVIANGANAVFWNPAGVSQVKTNNLFTSYNQWPASISIGGMAFAKNFGRIGAVAVSAIYLMTDDMEITTVEQPEGTGEFFSLNNYSVGLTYSRDLTDRVSVGITTKLVHEEYYNYGYNTWALDLGTLYQTDFHGLKLGMSILHFAPEIRFDGNYIDWSDPSSYATQPNPTPKSFEQYSLPINFRFGMAIDLLDITNHHVTLATDMIHPNNNIEQYNVGVEYGFSKMVFLRTGYRLSARDGGLSFGGGLKLGWISNLALQIDYSYVDMGILNNVNRFSVSFTF